MRVDCHNLRPPLHLLFTVHFADDGALSSRGPAHGRLPSWNLHNMLLIEAVRVVELLLVADGQLAAQYDLSPFAAEWAFNLMVFNR